MSIQLVKLNEVSVAFKNGYLKVDWDLRISNLELFFVRGH